MFHLPHHQSQRQRLQMLETFQISPICPAILAHGRPFRFWLLLSISRVSFILAGCFWNSRRATKRYFSATLRIFILQLGPQTRQRRGAHMGIPNQYVGEHRNVRWRVLVGERTVSGLHFANLLPLNHHNYKCRRIVIY